MLQPKLRVADRIARKVFRNYHGFFPEHIPTKYQHTYSPSIDGILGIYRKTKVVCSGECCGNPRKHGVSLKEKLTLQERRSVINFKEQSESLK